MVTLCVGGAGLAHAQQWERVGRVPDNKVTKASTISMVVSPSGTPYIAYKEEGNSYQLAVKRLNTAGTGWQVAGGAKVSSGWIDSFSIAVAPNGTVYAAFAPISDGKRANVKRLNAAGTVWESVGNSGSPFLPGMSQGEATNVSLAIDSTGTPYIAYRDVAQGSKATVMRLNADGLAWEAVGSTPPSTGAVGTVSLAFGPQDTLYLAYQDQTRSNVATVMRLSATGTHWEKLVDVDAGQVNNLSLAVSPNNTPYVAFNDAQFSKRTLVQRLSTDETRWEWLGTPSSEQGKDLSFAFAPDGTPYLAYSSGANGDHAVVKRFNAINRTWETAGSEAISDGKATSSSLAFGPDGTPYLAFVDWANAFKGAVKQLPASGSTWEPVGEVAFMAGSARYTSLAIGTQGNPHVAYADFTNGRKATVIRLNAARTGWEPAGPTGFSAGAIMNPTMAIGPDGHTYVVYRDSTTGKATVMQLNGTGSAWEPVGSAGPSEGYAISPSMVLGLDGAPYVGFGDTTQDNKATVRRWNASNASWETVGNAGFSPGGVNNFSLAQGPNGELYAGFQDAANDQKATVMHFNRVTSTWQLVGPAGLTSGRASFISLAVSPNGTPHLAYQSTAFKGIVLRPTAAGDAWETVATGDAFWLIENTALTFGPDGKPFAAFKIRLSTGQAYVMQLNPAGTQWVDLGSHVSEREAFEPSMAFGPDGKLYLAYGDYSQEGIATVKRWSRSFATLPRAATNVLATAGTGRATVTFDAPSDTGGIGIPIQSYTVTSRPDNINCPVTIQRQSVQQTCTAVGLRNGISYSFTVVPVSAVGAGSQATSNSVTPLSLTLAAPQGHTSAELGQPYALQLTPVGGSGSYLFSFSDDSPPLPAGLSLNPSTGVISGTPISAVGSYPLIIQVTDTDGDTTQLEFSLVILAAPINPGPGPGPGPGPDSGSGSDPNSNTSSLTPVPTLSQWAMLLISLMIVGTVAGRTRKYREK